MGQIFHTFENHPDDAVRIDHKKLLLPIEYKQLDGLYAHPAFIKAIVDLGKGPQSMGTVLNAVATGNAWARLLKTVYSPWTMIRNLVGNISFGFVNGHLGISSTNPWSIARRNLGIVTKVGQEIVLGVGNTVGLQSDKRATYLSKMRRLGMLDQDIDIRTIEA